MSDSRHIQLYKTLLGVREDVWNREQKRKGFRVKGLGKRFIRLRRG